MSTAAKNESATAQKIINHMNKDHVHNIEDFLVVYGHVDQDVAQRRPQMESITCSSMTLSYVDMNGGRSNLQIAIEPTLESLDDARAKLVEMSQKAAAKRGFSEYLVNEVPFLKSNKDYVAIAFFGVLYYCAIRPNHLKYALDRFEVPAGVQHYIMNYHTGFFRLLTFLHSVEAVVILYPLLRKFRMGTMKKIASMGLCVVEGAFFVSAFRLTVDKVMNPNRAKEQWSTYNFFKYKYTSYN